jgi:hypothetical protein
LLESVEFVDHLARVRALLPDVSGRKGVDQLDEAQHLATPAQPDEKRAVGQNAVSLWMKWWAASESNREQRTFSAMGSALISAESHGGARWARGSIAEDRRVTS